jgi:hypothetical protein
MKLKAERRDKDSDYLARVQNCPQISEKSGYDLNSAIDLLGGDFQNPFSPRIVCLG